MLLTRAQKHVYHCNKGSTLKWFFVILLIILTLLVEDSNIQSMNTIKITINYNNTEDIVFLPTRCINSPPCVLLKATKAT